MLFRPDEQDFRLIGFYTGRVMFGLGVVMLLPAALAFALGEHNDGLAFVIAASVAIALSRITELTLHTRAPLTTSLGLATVTLSWLTASVFGAIPLLLSGHFDGFLDAYFEAMSGFTTNGLTLAQDLDHLSASMNLWRHLMLFMGGQGIIVVVLSAFAVSSGITSLYTGEGREEKILPNVVRTARFIWRVALAYAAIGTTMLTGVLLFEGMPPGHAVYHAVTLFITTFDTGGFAVHSTSAAFYRSQPLETALMVLMLAGAVSFAIHYQLWHGRRGELVRNIEARTLAFSILALFAVAAIGLLRTGTFTGWEILSRQGFFQVMSAHTTTGLMTVPVRMVITDWGALAPATLVTGMALGGMAGSTAGGIKAIRVGVMLKGLKRDIRRALLPENAVVIETYHSTSRRILRDDQVRGAATLFLLWLGLYLFGAAVGLFYGYDLDLALFESVAAASSGGMSVGVARPDLEWVMKVTYMVQMLVGRLEFIAVFALIGYVVAIFRGRV